MIGLALLCSGALAGGLHVEVEGRPRLEAVPDRTGTEGGFADIFVIQRSRLGVGMASEGERVEAFVQIQDVRGWGSEFNAASGGEGSLSDFSADGLDLHQGWARFGSLADQSWDLTVGRQEIAWHNERLLGAVGWAQQARSLDGLRLRGASETLRGEVVAVRLLELPNAVLPSAGPLDGVVFYGATVGAAAGPASVNLVALATTDIAAGLTQMTAGGSAELKASALTIRGEGYGQFGSRAGRDVSALMAAVGVDTSELLEPAVLTAGVDLVGGDADPTDAQDHAFDTLLATNHKFYGHMDYYLDLPVSTAARGLLDVYAGVAVSSDGYRVGVTGHPFRAVAGATDADHGFEVDLDSSVPVVEGAKIVGGGGIYLPGSFWPTEDPGLFTYLMVVVGLGIDDG